MAEFFPEVLDELRTPAFLERVCGKFHYEEARMPELRAVAQELLPLLRREAFWERKEAPTGLLETEESDRTYENVVMSLGSGVDRLQDRYGTQGLLSESYMIEALAGELLLRGYEAYNRFIRSNMRRHVARYHFPGGGGALPLELLPDLLGEAAGRVICNAAFCMLPRKSVAFVAELTPDEKIGCEGICAGCGRTHCPNRIPEVPAAGYPPSIGYLTFGTNMLQ
ncbi:MAG: hypothetical protein NC399_00650 [Muribaculum sp.]|nr:hypothetical protein [Muribaculum sp.]